MDFIINISDFSLPLKCEIRYQGHSNFKWTSLDIAIHQWLKNESHLVLVRHENFVGDRKSYEQWQKLFSWWIVHSITTSSTKDHKDNIIKRWFIGSRLEKTESILTSVLEKDTEDSFFKSVNFGAFWHIYYLSNSQIKFLSEDFNYLSLYPDKIEDKSTVSAYLYKDFLTNKTCLALNNKSKKELENQTFWNNTVFSQTKNIDFFDETF